MRLLALVLLMLLVGCNAGPDHVTLDERWQPLRRMQEARWVQEGDVQTAIPVVWVRTVQGFLRLSLVEQNAVLAHEQWHGQQQAFYGMDGYLRLYEDRKWRATEEKEGWSRYIRWRVRHGEHVDPQWVATRMNAAHPGTFAYDGLVEWAANEVSKATAGD